MPLADIKHAGILAGFERWGWPWHGVISGGTIGSTGKAHAQPPHNDAWLIDRALPALTLTPEKIASEALAGREWRNYALIPGGYAYGTAIGAETFIHIDSIGAAWRIALAYSFPAAQTLRVTATITRFGKLIISETPVVPVSVTKTVDVVCVEIELLNAVSQQQGVGVAYAARIAALADVYTNGSKALLGISMTDGGVLDLFSVVELTLTGSGGGDGSGLVLAAVEVLAQPNLTEAVVNIDIHTPVIPAIVWTSTHNYQVACNDQGLTSYEVTWTASDSPDSFMFNADNTHYYNGTTYARYAYYKQTGEAVALRMRVGTDIVGTLLSWNKSAVINPVETRRCGDNLLLSAAHDIVATSTVRTVKREGYSLLENDTVIDSVWWNTTEERTMDTHDNYFNNTTAYSVTVTPEGALASFFPPAIHTFLNQFTMLNAFRGSADSAYSVDVQVETTSIYFGIHRMKSKASAFVADNGTTKAYGLAATALGPLTVGLTPALTTQFAWQRKTLDYSFASSALAYV